MKKKTVCSKDFNLPANLYDFLPGGDTEPIQGRGILPLHVKRLCESFESPLLAEFDFFPPLSFFFFLFSALGKERKKKFTYLDAPAVTCRIVKSEAKRCVSLYLFNDDARYFATFALPPPSRRI